MDLDSKVNCEACGYDLMGLTGRGRCPECGNRYDMINNLGVTRQSAAMEAHHRGDRLVYRVKFWAMAAAAGLCIILGAWGTAVSKTQSAGPLAIGLVFAGVFGFGAFATWFTEGRPRNTPPGK